PVPHGERRVERSLSVVLMRRRCSEHGHDRVAGELLECASRELDLLLHRPVEALEPGTHALRVILVCERRRPYEVCKQNRRDLALASGAARRHGGIVPPAAWPARLVLLARAQVGSWATRERSLERLLPDVERLVELGVLDHEGDEDANHVR